MTQWTFEDLEHQRNVFDRAVAATPAIDKVCSSSAWCLAAAETLHQGTESEILAVHDGFLAFARQDLTSWGRIWMPLESSWCLASPLIGPDPLRLVDVLAARLRESRDWDSVFVSGIPVDGEVWNQLTVTLGRFCHLYRGPAVIRCIAHLDQGPYRFLARRSVKFRKNLRRSLRMAESLDLSFEYQSLAMPKEQWAPLFQRVLDVESRGWKGRSGNGINQEPMRSFYRRLIALLGASGDLRLLIARQNDRDVGYILGCVQFGTYRGFQFSFDADLADISLGNLMQWYQIGLLCKENVRFYDLGTDMAYKRRWSDETFETGTMVIRRNPL